MRAIKNWIEENTDLSVRSVLETVGIILKAIYDGLVALMLIDFVSRNL